MDDYVTQTRAQHIEEPNGLAGINEQKMRMFALRYIFASYPQTPEQLRAVRDVMRMYSRFQLLDRASYLLSHPAFREEAIKVCEASGPIAAGLSSLRDRYRTETPDERRNLVPILMGYMRTSFEMYLGPGV